MWYLLLVALRQLLLREVAAAMLQALEQWGSRQQQLPAPAAPLQLERAGELCAPVPVPPQRLVRRSWWRSGPLRLSGRRDKLTGVAVRRSSSPLCLNAALA